MLKKLTAWLLALAMVVVLASTALAGESAGDKVSSTADYEISVGGVTGTAHYEDTDNGDEATKGFVITFDGNEIKGGIDKGVWTAEDPAFQDVVSAVQEQFEGNNDVGGGESAGGEGESAEEAAPAEGESEGGESEGGESAGEPAQAEAEDAELPEQGLTITEVAYGAGYVETAATEADWINSPSASSNIASVTLSNGEVVEAENGGVLTLVVDGDYYDILDYVEAGTPLEGQYSFETTAGTEQYSEMAKFMNMAGNTAEYTYRSALKVNADGIVAEETIESLLTKGVTHDGTKTIGGEIHLNGPFFNGIIVDSTDYSITGTTIYAYGDGANDFQGEAAAVLAEGTANLTLEDVYIETSGVIRTGAVVKGNGILYINNSIIYAQESEDTEDEYHALVVPMMKRTPMALGLEGGVRATNVLGAGQGIYRDSLFVCTGWGVLSTDSGQSYANTGTYALDVQNCVAGIGTLEEVQEGKEYDATAEHNGVTYGFTNEGSGYIAYADANVYDYFENSTFYGGNEVGIIAGGFMEFINCDVNSLYIGIMTHGSNCEAYLTDCDINVGYTVYQVKSGSANSGCSGNILIDNCTINFTGDQNYTGTIVELIESDDAGNPGTTEFEIQDLGDQATAVADTGNKNAVADIKNGEYEGNIWNNLFSEVETLEVNLDNAALTGTISSSYGYHVDLEGNRVENGTVLQADNTGNYIKSGITDYAVIGALYNVANQTINNPIDVTLANASSWTVKLADGTNGEADACYIHSLTVDATSKVLADEAVTVYYCGELNIEDGAEISENVTFEAFERKVLEAEPAASTYAVEDFAHNTLTINIVDEDGSPVEGAVTLFKSVESQGIFFTLQASGYEIVSGLEEVAVSEDPTYEKLAALDGDTVLTVVVAKAAAGGSEGGQGGGEGGGESAGEGGGEGESAGEGGGEGESAGEAAPAEAGESEGESAAEEAPAEAGDTSEEAYHAYLKEYVQAVPAVSDEQFEEFAALIDASDYTTMPADMMFDATWWGYAAMTYDEFVAAGGVYEIPAFDPNLAAD